MALTIPAETWLEYIKNLRKINEAAGNLVSAKLIEMGGIHNADQEELISYAYAVATQFGEAAAALTCEMYDAIGIASGMTIPPAEPAELPTLPEVARAVNGTAKFSVKEDVIGASVGRLVKRTGVDTTIKNALRDGAEWAWIPQGEETCAFCLMLASRGWQKASKDALKKGHAEHIHAHCDCTYAIRFDSRTQYEGYDPDKYLKMYEDAEGNSWQEKLNSMRRNIREEHKEEINARRRKT